MILNPNKAHNLAGLAITFKELTPDTVLRENQGDRCIATIARKDNPSYVLNVGPFTIGEFHEWLEALALNAGDRASDYIVEWSEHYEANSDVLGALDEAHAALTALRAQLATAFL